MRRCLKRGRQRLQCNRPHAPLALCERILGPLTLGEFGHWLQLLYHLRRFVKGLVKSSNIPPQLQPAIVDEAQRRIMLHLEEPSESSLWCMEYAHAHFADDGAPDRFCTPVGILDDSRTSVAGNRAQQLRECANVANGDCGRADVLKGTYMSKSGADASGADVDLSGGSSLRTTNAQYTRDVADGEVNSGHPAYEAPGSAGLTATLNASARSSQMESIWKSEQNRHGSTGLERESRNCTRRQAREGKGADDRDASREESRRRRHSRGRRGSGRCRRSTSRESRRHRHRHQSSHRRHHRRHESRRDREHRYRSSSRHRRRSSSNSRRRSRSRRRQNSLPRRSRSPLHRARDDEERNRRKGRSRSRDRDRSRRSGTHRDAHGSHRPPSSCTHRRPTTTAAQHASQESARSLTRSQPESVPIWSDAPDAHSHKDAMASDARCAASASAGTANVVRQEKDAVEHASVTAATALPSSSTSEPAPRRSRRRRRETETISSSDAAFEAVPSAAGSAAAAAHSGKRARPCVPQPAPADAATEEPVSRRLRSRQKL